MPPSGGTRTSLVSMTVQARQSYGWSGGVFSPGTPLVPSDPQPVRVFDFLVGSNTSITPRSGEAFGFAALRAFSNVELVRLAIETRKDQLEALDWKIKSRDARKPKPGADGRIAEVQKFWRRPDGVLPFSTWLRKLLEDLFVIDAPALERRRTRGGGLLGLDVVPGDTIKLLVDQTGRRPAPPEAAYQQVIKGRVWADLTAEDLIYAPRNPRPNHLYGYGPVEQIIVTINTLLRRQSVQLAHFTSGNVPRGIINAPEGWTSEQLKTYQTWFDSILAGNLAEQSKLIWVGAGAKYTPFIDPPFKDDFDDWLARIVMFAFSLPPTPFIRQLNRSTSENDKERAQEEGLAPLKLWWKRIADDVIQKDLGYDDLEWGWNEDVDVDPAAQSEIDDRNLKNGSSTIDEIRDGRGQDPLPNGLGSRPLLFAAGAPVLLEQVIDQFENPPEPVAPVVGDPAMPPAKAGPKGRAPKPEPTAAEKLEKRLPSLSLTRPLVRRAEASILKAVSDVFASMAAHVSTQVAMKLRALHKAADDTGGVIDPAKLATLLDLQDLGLLTDLTYDDLLAIVYDAAERSIAGLGVKTTDELVDQLNQAAVDWARQRSGEMVRIGGADNIVDTTREMLRQVIADGLAENLDADGIAALVQGSTAFSAERAALIAATEVAMANAGGKLAGWQGADDQGIALQTSWQTSNNGLCCDECEANQKASPIPFGSRFPSGHRAEPAHPRCRCVVFAEPVPPTE